jgi:WD40 repeat protein
MPKSCTTVLRGILKMCRQSPTRRTARPLPASSDKTVRSGIQPFTFQQALSKAVLPSLCSFLPDGKSLAVVNDNQRLSLWDIPSGTRTQTLGTDGKTTVVTSLPGKVHLLDLATRTSSKVFSHGGFPSAVAVSPDNSLIVWLQKMAYCDCRCDQHSHKVSSWA